jgi:uncharacterized membrane protein
MNLINRFASRNGGYFLLVLIVLVALVLRLYHLGYQSFWLDEVYTAIESDPRIRDHDLLFYLKYVEQQPPLFFLLERFAIWLFGNNEASLRLIPALAGTASVWAMYLLGKEIKGPRLGLFAAALMAINFFGISYSQEARPYTLVLLFSILSWVALLRFLKTVDLRSCLQYAGITLLMLHTNYFGLFVVLGQIIVSAILWLTDEPQKKKWFRLWALSGLIIAIGFAPLIPLFRNVAHIDKFWADKPAESVGIDFFFEYFGSSDLLKPFLLLLLISFFVHLFQALRPEEKGIRNNPLALVFTVCSVWIFISFFIPYVRSLMVVPMMVIRYTTTAVPAFILLLAAGLESIAARIVRGILFAIFCLLSFTHLFLIKDYYHQVSKAQFRELGAFVAADSAFNTMPVITDYTAWHQSYYLGKYHYQGAIHRSPLKFPEIDSVFFKPDYQRGFWLTGAHKSPTPDKLVADSLAKSFVLLKDVQLLDAWAQLYVAKDYWGKDAVWIDPKVFPSENRYQDNGQEVIAAWNGRPLTTDIDLKAGAYKLVLVVNGTPMENVYPHMHCAVNGLEIGSAALGKIPEVKTYDFSVSKDTLARLSLSFDNDAENPETHEDRNMLIHRIIIAPRQ